MRIPDSEQLVRLRRNVLKWFSINGRRLPWRLSVENDDVFSSDQKAEIAYRVWISEIMLQQTTTTTVCGYFERFMTQYPSVDKLASADISDILKLWEGLGYYRRAHQLHKATQKIVSDFHGKFPDNVVDVSSLPGVGKYTAGAILSIAFDKREPILEANTIRLHSRLIGLESNPMKSEGNKILWNFARTILPLKRSGIFNQALMDLGSTICAVKDPDCRHCPCVFCCEAAQTGAQNFLPALEKKAEKEARLETAILVVHNHRVKNNPLINNPATLKSTDKFLLICYPKGGRWTGLWDFPRFLQIKDADPQNDPDIQHEFEKIVNYSFKGSVTDLPQIGKVLHKIHHSVTRYKITLLFCGSTWPKIPLSNIEKNSSQNFFTNQNQDRIRKIACKSIVENFVDNHGVNDVNNIDIKTEKNTEGENVRIQLASGDFCLSDIQTRWTTLAEAHKMPLSSTGRKLLEFLEKSNEE